MLNERGWVSPTSSAPQGRAPRHRTCSESSRGGPALPIWRHPRCLCFSRLIVVRWGLFAGSTVGVRMGRVNLSDRAWRLAFALAWDSALAGTTPVGAVVIDSGGAVGVAEGRGRRYEPAMSGRQLVQLPRRARRTQCAGAAGTGATLRGPCAAHDVGTVLYVLRGGGASDHHDASLHGPRPLTPAPPTCKALPLRPGDDRS